jgi:hypothetical protein
MGDGIAQAAATNLMNSNNGGDIGGKFSRGWKPYFRT